MTQTGWNLKHSYQLLPEHFYAKVEPTPVKAPAYAVFNGGLAAELGLPDDLKHHPELLSGNELPEGADPVAQAYAGHQFGQFTMLGDGRAVLIGEQVTNKGRRFDIQLKGSGRTPFSRRGDGRAGLAPMLREYMISEAMYGLGIPTNRTLAVTTTGEHIQREIEIPGAVLTRVSSSHLRVGTFQYAAGLGDVDALRLLADYAVQRHYPEAAGEEKRYAAFYEKVVEQQAALIAQWQLVGFIHGVMNTDNMSISGETFDYGPCAFMDVYHPETVFSSIDAKGRYAYQNQPPIGQWNLARLAESLIPILDEEEDAALETAQEILGRYGSYYQKHWVNGMREKLGFLTEENQDEALMDDLLDMMKKQEADYTNTFRALTLDRPEELPMWNSVAFSSWYDQWKKRLERQDQPLDLAFAKMKQANPAIIPRNHRVEEALEAVIQNDDYSVMENLMEQLKNPYEYSAAQEPYAQPPEPSDLPYRTYCGT
ncbi:protein adenylyltransferase SelO [Halobacillus litoralis]|uniref:protein adenylyltransferase SelO n=1 Tax=Halobacillus litoralis TaxID=45668 RepID=UPI0013705B77|nr:YdiU family protein [Halobacillus litoralis]MYL37422.1 YdiU family protein [Halobacillus litoralis]